MTPHDYLMFFNPTMHTTPKNSKLQSGVKEIYGLFDKASAKYGAVVTCHWEQFQCAFGNHYRLIIINALDTHCYDGYGL